MRLSPSLIVLALLASPCPSCSKSRKHNGVDARKLDAASAAVQLDAGVPPSPIMLENMHAGVSHEAPDKPATSEVAGYSSAVSGKPGDEIKLFVNVDHAQDVHWELYRVGYYGGLGSRFIARSESRAVTTQPECPIEPTTGLIECSWASAFDVTVASDWVSGYYFFELINADGFGSRVPFVVREGGRRAAALAQASVTTWQAYNRWGGISIYGNDKADGVYKQKRGRRVSFDRPYQTQNEFDPFLHALRFLEQRGYDVSYTTNVDIDTDPTVLTGRKLFMTLGHDEYWSIPQRNALEAARDQGVSLAFLSGNTGYWRIRYESSSLGVPRRIMTCYKSTEDPVKNAPDTTVLYASPPQARPENALLGVLYRTWSKVPGFPYIVRDPKHWVYEGTGVQEHEALNNVVGPEWDGFADNGVSPPGLEIVAGAATISSNDISGNEANATVYYPTPKSIVFAAGTIDWGLGLADGRYSDPRIERMTENVIKRAGVITLMPPVVPPARGAGLHVEAKVLAGSGDGGQIDDVARKATFDGPSGIAAGPDGKLYILDHGDSAIRVLARDGKVSTFVTGAAAGLWLPIGIAIASDGTLYVSDSRANKISKITANGTASVIAGSGDAGKDDASDPQKATFSGPRGIALGAKGELYVADSQNDSIRRIDATGVTTIATGLRLVHAVAAGNDGDVYFAAMGPGQLGVVHKGQVKILANVSGVPGNVEGPAEQARLQPGEGMIFEQDRLVFADTENNRVRALSLTGDAKVSTLYGDGNGATDASDAQHASLPRALARLDGGYALTDFGNHRIVWFKP